MTCFDNIKSFYDNNYFTIIKNLIDNLTTFLSFFTLLGIIQYDNVNQTITDFTNFNQENFFIIIMTGICCFFGLIRNINDFLNKCRFGKNIPEQFSKGDYIGIFGEDLSVLCIDVIKKGMGIYPNTYDLISTIFSSINFCFLSLYIMFKIAFVGITNISNNNENNINNAICIINFLLFVGVSGFMVLFRYIYAEVGNDAAIDMFLLYIIYILISIIHTYIFINTLKDYL